MLYPQHFRSFLLSISRFVLHIAMRFRSTSFIPNSDFHNVFKVKMDAFGAKIVNPNWHDKITKMKHLPSDF